MADYLDQGNYHIKLNFCFALAGRASAFYAELQNSQKNNLVRHFN